MKFSISWYCLFVFGLGLVANQSAAQTMYVTDELKLTLRSGPSMENRILSIIETGQSMEVLEPGTEWSRVRMADGKEGWVLTRYLTDKPTSSILLSNLQKKYDSMSSQFETFKQENIQLKQDNEKLRSELSTREEALAKITEDYNTLKADSAEYIDLKSKYEEASSQLAQKSQRLESLEQELTKLELNQYIKWFIAGSGVLLVGFVIGFSTKRQRRRSSLV
jgi:SH3 domain protein